MARPQWQWNEFQQAGTDYEDIKEVQAYDSRMATLRDVVAENAAIFNMLKLSAGSSVLEIGCGTGAFARFAAGKDMRVTALDISDIMLQYARQKAQQEKLDNIEFTRGGFLSFEPEGQKYDAIISSMAMHHLPDTWKAVAIDRIYGWLKPGGSFFLRDVVFTLPVAHSNPYFDMLVDERPESIKKNMAMHIAQEYSTLDWIMEALLLRSGFEICHNSGESRFLQIYHCRKPFSGYIT